MLFKTEAIVLRKKVFGENEALLTIFSKKIGKVQSVVRGFKKTKGKGSSNIQAFTYGEFMLYKGKNLYQISQVDFKKSFHKIHEDVIKLSYGSYILELTESSIIEGENNPKLFNLLIDFLDILGNKKVDVETLVKAYEVKLMLYAGYMPVLTECVSCGNPNDSSYKFSSRQGGILCRQCLNKDSYAMNISSLSINVMRYLIKSPLDKIIKLKIQEDVKGELDKIIKNYILTHLGKRTFNSLEFLESIKSLKI
ncbi:DNA repair protein RecO [Anaeromicrobium sediminis]|uniref:DNA repair protein RecO n=1 Tax=Anaeromicrobium sediminis TaxID=1478221 RepID=A0A267MH79_9FIRM|nr:DNA repair protein RecO [Anaeromicrobium sediminis]PAB58919.1 DNA repair protein RecO [Anaeromicrobium sediminis]